MNHGSKVTALRPCETCLVRVKDVDLRARVLRVPTTEEARADAIRYGVPISPDGVAKTGAKTIPLNDFGVSVLGEQVDFCLRVLGHSPHHPLWMTWTEIPNGDEVLFDDRRPLRTATWEKKLRSLCLPEIGGVPATLWSAERGYVDFIPKPINDRHTGATLVLLFNRRQIRQVQEKVTHHSGVQMTERYTRDSEAVWAAATDEQKARYRARYYLPILNEEDEEREARYTAEHARNDRLEAELVEVKHLLRGLSSQFGQGGVSGDA